MLRSGFRCTVRSLLVFFLGMQLFLGPAWAGTEEGNPFVQLNARGVELSADALSWAMVKDTKTGLIWEAKTTDGSVHDATQQYTWREANGVFLAALNAEGFGGFNDWRLPDEAETKSIIRLDQEAPFVDRAYFPLVQPMGYWNLYICGSGERMSARKSFGTSNPRAAKHYVLAVRGTMP